MLLSSPTDFCSASNIWLMLVELGLPGATNLISRVERFLHGTVQVQQNLRRSLKINFANVTFFIFRWTDHIKAEIASDFIDDFRRNAG